MFVSVKVSRGKVKVQKADKTDDIQLRMPGRYEWALESNMKIQEFEKHLFETMDKMYSKHGIEIYMCPDCRSVYLVEREDGEVLFFSFAESSFWDGCFCGVLTCI